MGISIQDFGAGGGRPLDLQQFVQGSISGEPLVWFSDLGGEPQDREDPRWIPPQDGPSSGDNVAKSEHSGAVGIPTSGHSNGGGGYSAGGYICTSLP